MKSCPSALALALVLALGACGGEEEAAAPAEATSAEVPTAAELAAVAAQPTPAQPAPGLPPGAPGAQPGLPGAPGAPAIPNMNGLTEGLGAAMLAGEENANLPPCEQAYASITAMLAAMQKQFGPGQANGDMPPREQFVSGCSELPVEMQRCMTMQYAMTHQAECQQLRETLDPETIARVQGLMGRPGR